MCSRAGGHRLQRHRQHGEAVANLRGRSHRRCYRTSAFPTIADLPVGENFRDHYSVRIVARVKNIRTSTKCPEARPRRPDRALGARPALVLAVARRWSIGFGSPTTRWSIRTCKGCSLAGQLQAGILWFAGRLSGMTAGRLAASSREPGFCACPLHRPVRGSRRSNRII